MITSELFGLASGAASFVTPSISLGDLTTYSVFVLFPGGGTLDGTLTLESSPNQDDANFVTVGSSSQAVTGSTQHEWSCIGQGYQYVRMRWVYGSGAGNMKAIIQIKETNISKGG
jgi:hypothetical protein